MRHLFDIRRTVRTFSLYFGDEHAGLLGELLQQVARCLQRVIPPPVSRQVDREGSTLLRRDDGKLLVKRHPALEAARRELAGLDLFRIFLPADVGGYGLPLCLYYMAVQLVSYFDTSLALVFLVHGNAMYTIDHYGTPAQRARYLPSLASGERLATVAFTEPSAGSDAGNIRTRAVRRHKGWVLSGEKLFITHGGDADLLVTTARTGSVTEQIHGVSAFILEREADGVQVLGLEDKTGLAGSPTAALGYPELYIPADRLLGGAGRGGAVMLAGVGMTRVNIGAQALGIGRRALDAAVDFALQRVQGGRCIVDHDAVLQRLSQMALIISATENLICHDSLLEHQGLWHVREMSIAKYYASEALQELTQRAINVHGGYGVCRSYEVERCRREAVALPLYGGTSEIQWFIIARELLDSLAGRAHADYRERDRELAAALQARSTGAPAPLAELARGIRLAQKRLWAVVEHVAGLPDPVPHHRHLAELATALAVASVLLWQATGPEADELDCELATWAADLLEDQAARAEGRIRRGITRGRLKEALRRRLGGE